MLDVTSLPLPAEKLLILGSLRDMRMLLAGGMALGDVLVPRWGRHMGLKACERGGKRWTLLNVNAIAELHRGKQPSSASHHDNVVFGEASWELCHVAPVGCLLAGNDNVGGC